MPFSEQNIRRALNSGEFVPYFQPLVEIRTGIIHGFEILARWRLSARSIVPPSRFIPLVESFGLMNDLTTSLLIRSFAAVLSLPHNFGLSVNLSPSQLHDRKLPELMHRLANEANFDLRRLTVELTESALVDDVDLAGLVASDLKKLGIRLALDDFGTGYSSLLHLQALPFDELKVDISFVRSMVHSRQSRKITAAVVSLGLSLGLQTVAEGVEEQAQANLLSWQGCSLGQGYLYGAPVAAEQLAASLSHEHTGVGSLTELPASIADFSLSLDAHPTERLAQIRAIYDGAPVGLAFVDCNLRYVNLNQKLAEINRQSVQSHLGREVRDVLPDIYSQFEPYLKRALAGESIAGIEVERPPVLPGDRVKTMLVSYQPVQDEAGEILGVCVSVADISTVKEKEAALRESEDHYRHTVELNPQAPWVMDPEGNNIACSSRWETITGLTSAETKGYGWMTALHPDDRQPALNVIESSLRTGTPIDVEYRVRDRENAWRWMRSRGAPRRNVASEIIRWYGSVECIDEHKRAIDDLRCSEARLRAIFNAAPVGVVLAESVTGKVLKANPRAEQLLGFNFAPDMVWTSEGWEAFDDCGRPIDGSDLPLLQAMQGVESLDAQEVLLRRPDGSEIWLSLTASPVLSENGTLLGGVLIVQDIDTARRSTSGFSNLHAG
jgi:PAS domain S-box-containing protein